MSEQNDIDATEFETKLKGVHYKLPDYRVVEGEGLVKLDTSQDIFFVRGSKIAGEVVPSFDGILHETLLAMMIEDLKYKHKLVPSKETAKTIDCLEEALNIQQQRQQRRKEEGTQGTYKE